MAKHKVCVLFASSLPAGMQASDRFNQIQTDEKAKAALKNSELLQQFWEVETRPERENSVLLEIFWCPGKWLSFS